MTEIVHRVDAPCVAGAVVMLVHDPVDGRVAHDHIGRGHVDLGPQGAGALGQFAVFHLRKKSEVLLHRAVAVRAVFAWLGQGAPVFAHILRVEMADIGLAHLDQLDREVVELVKII